MGEQTYADPVGMPDDDAVMGRSAPTLACPACHAPGGALPAIGDNRAPAEWRCVKCGFAAPYADGVWDARTRRDHPLDFSRQWQLWERGVLGPRDLLYGNTPDQDFAATLELIGITPAALAGRRVLEVGYGHGRILAKLQDHCDAAFGLDLVKPLRSSGLRPGSVLCGSLFEMPFVPAQFDLVLCRGVIHHTDDPRLALSRLVEQLAPGGTLYLYVYEIRLPRSLALRRIAPRSWAWPESVRVGLSWALGTARTGMTLADRPSLRPADLWHRLGNFTLGYYDILSPRWTSTHSPTQISGWFADHGLTVERVSPCNYVGRRPA